MRDLLLTAAIMLALTGASVASEQKNAVQPQSKQTQQVQMARSGADGSMDHASPAQSDCMPKAGKHLRPKKNQQQDVPEGDPGASQNQVEYGGAG